MDEAEFTASLRSELSDLAQVLRRDFPESSFTEAEIQALVHDAWTRIPEGRPRQADEVFSWARGVLFRQGVMECIGRVRESAIRLFRAKAKGEAERVFDDSHGDAWRALLRRPDGQFPRTEADALRWILRCMTNRFIEEARQKQRRPTTALADDVPARSSDASSEPGRLQVCVSRLQGRRRAVIDLFLAGHKPNVIAREMKVAAMVVYNEIKRAKEDLKKCLGTSHE